MNDFQSWRCKHDEKLFCPPEGCPKSYGCARDHGWLPGQPSPDGCTGLVRRTAPPRTPEQEAAERYRESMLPRADYTPGRNEFIRVGAPLFYAGAIEEAFLAGHASGYARAKAEALEAVKLLSEALEAAVNALAAQTKDGEA